MLWTFLLLGAAAQQPPECETTTLGQLARKPAPAVFVLGERKGTPPDQARAWRLARKLSRKGPVTLALQAVHIDQQPVLDAWSQGRIPDDQLGAKLQIFDFYGTGPDRYDRLIRGADIGLDVVAVGVDPAMPPADAITPQPPGYIHLLSAPMGDHPVPVELEGRYTSMVAYTDFRVASRAIEAWGGEGYLVILADRLHVEGDKGISWQASLLTSAPVHSVMLTQSDSPCYPGDVHVRWL